MSKNAEYKDLPSKEILFLKASHEQVYARFAFGKSECPFKIEVKNYKYRCNQYQEPFDIKLNFSQRGPF